MASLINVNGKTGTFASLDDLWGLLLFSRVTAPARFLWKGN